MKRKGPFAFSQKKKRSRSHDYVVVLQHQVMVVTEDEENTPMSEDELQATREDTAVQDAGLQEQVYGDVDLSPGHDSTMSLLSPLI